MGIRNLNQFIEKSDLRKNHRLNNTVVVIDGKNLVKSLYGKHNKENPNDYSFGGNYTEYKKLYRKFFDNLKKCKISPIIVVDGALNPDLTDNRKLRFKQEHELLQKLNSMDQFADWPQWQILFPELLQMVFESVINECNRFEAKQSEHKRHEIFYFVTHLDADLEAAKLAIELKCPLISNDSDFFIMPINGGVVNIDSLQWDGPLEFNQTFIECQLYKFNDFLIKFDIKPEMLPIFGSVLGNDNIDNNVFEDLYKDVIQRTQFGTQFNQSVYHSNQITNERFNQFCRWLYWLSHNDGHQMPSMVIENYLKDKKIDPKKFRTSLKSYQTEGTSYLKQFYDFKRNKTDGKDIPIEEIVGDYRFPKWFLCEYFLDQKLSKNVFNFIDTKVFIKTPKLEDISLESCFESSFELYGFLLGLLRLKSKDNTPIKVLTRKGSDYQEIYIKPKTHISHNNSEDKVLPILSEIRELTETQRKELVLCILGFKEKLIIDLEESLSSAKINKKDIDFWQYFLIVIKYWKSKTKIRCHSFEFIRALVVSVINYRHNSLTRNELKSFEPKPKFRQFVVHYYNEFQVIYKSIGHIMSLLGNPIPSQKLHLFLNGSLICKLFDQIIGKSLEFYPFKEHRLNTINTFIMSSICSE